MHRCLLGVSEMLNLLSHALGLIQVHLPVHLPCYDLPPLVSALALGIFNCILTGESDGRCVRVSEPGSKGHSPSFLLLNPPSSTISCCVFVVFCSRKCSPFLPTSCATPRPDVLGCAHFAYSYCPHGVSWRRRYIGGGD